MTALRLVPIGLRAANAFVGLEHRHSGPVRGYKFALSAEVEGRLVGVVIVGRTVAKGLHAPARAEVTRLATDGDGSTNSCSFLYSAAKRAVQAMGYTSLKTYTLKSESGASLRAVGACCEAEVRGRSWNCKSRPRTDKHAIADRWRWELLKVPA